jgi:hypothetical protein
MILRTGKKSAATCRKERTREMNARNVEFLGRYQQHPMRLEVENALSVAEAFSESVRSIKADRFLSDEGRAAKINAKTRAALRDIRDFSAPILEMKQKRDTLVASIKPVSFAKDDVAGAVLRGELRAALKSMSLTEKAEVLTGEKAVAEFVDAALEAPALLSGLDANLFNRIREQRLATLFSAESFQAEALTEKIAEAESAMQLAKDDIGRTTAVSPHEFTKLVEAVNSRKNAVWLKRDKDASGEPIVVVVPVNGGAARVAGPDDLRDGRYYSSYKEYQEDRAA